jgi:glucose-6-phosphate 1-epimerase
MHGLFGKDAAMTSSTQDAIFAIAPGAGDLPRVTLMAADGARAEIYLHGAHVTSWAPAGGGEQLFLSRLSEYRAGAAIRGGVPVIFPQFSSLGPLPKHGFARSLPWTFAGAASTAEGAVAAFELRDSEASRRVWPHTFRAELTVAVDANRLTITLGVTNTGGAPFAYTAALHTYLAVDDVGAVLIDGLDGLRYYDNTAGGAEGYQLAPRVEFRGEVDRIYASAPAELRVVEPGRTTRVRLRGFPDAVVWNPGAAKGASLADLEPDGYRRFVCVEAAVAANPVRLAPEERWQGTQILMAEQMP